jgi:hypothetical protein
MHKKSQQGNKYSAIEEIRQQLMSLLAQDAFRMELHAFEIPFLMANPHDLLVSLQAVTSKHAGSVGGSITRE